MKRTMFLGLALSALLAPAVTIAPAAQTLILDAARAVELARGQGSGIAARETDLLAAGRELDAIWNLFLPGVRIEAEGKLGDTAWYPSARAAEPFSVKLGATLSLRLGSASLFEAEKRRLEYEGAALADEEARALLSISAEKAYWSLVAMGVDERNKNAALSLAGERTRLAMARYERGLSSEIELLQAQLAEEKARDAASQAAGTLRKAQSSFKRLLGLEADALIELADREVPDRGPLAFGPDGVSAESRFDIRKAARQLAEAERKLREDRTTRLWPVVSLSAGWSLSAVPSFSFRYPYLGATASMDLDSFVPGSAKELSRQRLSDARNKGALELASLKRAASDEISSLSADYDLARGSIALAERQLALAERLRDRTREAYERGAATMAALSDAQLEVETARHALLSQRYKALSILLDLGYALNIPAEELVRQHTP